MKLEYDPNERYVSLMAKDQYMREVRGMGRLTEEEVFVLFQQVAWGRVESAQRFPQQHVLRLALDARNRLIEDYQPLVISVARHYVSQSRGMELLDFVQEGNMVLLRLFETCDFDDANNILGFVCRCLHMGMRSVLRDRDGLIKVSARTMQFMTKVRHVRARLTMTLGHEPSLQEAATEMGVGVAYLVEVEQLEGRARGVKSLHGLFSEEDDESKYCLQSLYPSSEGAETTCAVEREQAVHDALTTALAEREGEVMRLRYGIEREGTLNQEEVAEKLGVHPRTVQRTERRAESRLVVALAPLYRDVQEELIA